VEIEEQVLGEPSELSGTLVFQASSGGAIYLLDLDNNELRYLADGLDPALSPDGSQVAFTRWDNPRGLYVIEVDSGQQRQLVGENLIKNPTWSPDGQRLIYSQQQGGSEAKTFIVPRFGEISIPEDPHWRLEVIDSDGSNLEGVPDQPHSFNPSWSEQGVLYAENGTIYITEPGGETWAFYSGSNEVRNPVWSPHGRYAVATMQFHDHWEIVRFNSDGSGLLRLTDNYDRVHSVAPTWSPDGETIAYLSDQDGSWMLWVMDIDGTNQRLLAPDLLAGIDFHYDFMAEHVVDWG
jgi:TolB protein